MNPYQRDIALTLDLADPADIDAVEDSMRLTSPTLDHLTARAFADLAREAWVTVRAVRVMDAAGVTVGHPAFLDPGLHAAAAIYVQRGQDGPLTRPLTFRAPQLGDPALSAVTGWVTYAIPAADWHPDMTPAQASTYDQGDLAEPGQTPEAICRRCGEIFTPDLSYPDRTGLEHYESAEHMARCGGAGDIAGWWG